MQALAVRPQGYDAGAYRLVIRLSPDEQEIVRTAPFIAFELPRLPNRTITPDAGFAVATNDSGVIRLRGVLRPDSGWLGHCHSNGVEESANPTPIGTIESALQQSAEGALASMRAWLNLG
ncbi:MAG TPA: hypothetical protein VFQ61_34305 [Polyangiaceae bacterium]|nr:hypothetical protein [Polyangiaceae bacterium]